MSQPFHDSNGEVSIKQQLITDATAQTKIEAVREELACMLAPLTKVVYCIF